MSGDHNMNQTDSGWRKRQIALDKKAENARELGLDYEQKEPMKLTEEQIWKCNQTINYENGEVVDGVHICMAHQNVVDFARSIEREIGFAKAKLWIKRINDAVEAEREACAAKAEQVGQYKNHIGIAAAIRARGQA